MPLLGDSHDFLDAFNVSGHFDNPGLPALPAGLARDTSRLCVDGVLSVAAAPEQRQPGTAAGRRCGADAPAAPPQLTKTPHLWS